MLILDPEKTIAVMLWEDLKEFPKEWAKLLLCTIPTDIAYWIFMSTYNKVHSMMDKAPWWEVILLSSLMGYIGGLLVW